MIEESKQEHIEKIFRNSLRRNEIARVKFNKPENDDARLRYNEYRKFRRSHFGCLCKMVEELEKKEMEVEIEIEMVYEPLEIYY